MDGVALMYAPTQRAFTTPGGHRVMMHYRRDTNDYNTLNASLDGDEYRLPSGLTGTAIDVGGYLGSVGIALAADNPGLRVVIIEPVPPNAELIRQNIDANGLAERITLVIGAVGKGGETVDVWYGYTGSESAEHHAFVGNSTLAYDHGSMLPHQTSTYKAISLASLVKAHGPLTLLKIDTEGAEWAFLSSPAVKDVGIILGEWHPVRGHTQDDMAALLVATHNVTFTGPDGGPGGFTAIRS